MRVRLEWSGSGWTHHPGEPLSQTLLKFILESGSGDGSDVPPTYINPAPE